MLSLCTRLDTDLTFRLGTAFDDSVRWMAQRRRWLALIAVVASVLDLVLTQTILEAVEHASGAQPAEANPLMAPIVMTWWAWPLRVGIPILAVARDLRARNYGLITVAAGLYGLVVVWNTFMLLRVDQVLGS